MRSNAFNKRLAALETGAIHRPASNLWKRIEQYRKYFAGEPVEDKHMLAKHDKYFQEIGA
jgi:hypothetical protein